MTSISILIGGKAGDGINEAGLLIAHILNMMGYRLYQYYDYPSLIRGGHNFSIVRASTKRIAAHSEKIEFLIALNQDTLELHRHRLRGRSTVVFDSDQVKTSGVDLAEAERIGLPIGQILKSENAPVIMRNSCIIGGFCRACGIPWSILEGAIRRKVTKLADLNMAVARRGYDTAREIACIEALESSPMPFITGNEAIGLGLLAAGLRAYIAYPMTPSSSILHFMAGRADQFQIKVVHPENEIAVILMALGFAYAGNRAAVGTSGGGFCLMTEGLSLAGQSEVPVTIVVSQRPGPSTGVPTYTAQSDLHFVLNAGQGEFPRLVVAPGDAEQAYIWSAIALELSWRYQIPAFILADKTLSESAFNLDPETILEQDEIARSIPQRLKVEPGLTMSLIKKPDIDEMGSRKAEDKDGPYLRYRLTASGVSPYAVPTEKGRIVKVNSYAHDEYGITAEAPEMIAAMQEKRLRKERSLAEALTGLETVKAFGDMDSETALVCWGSTKGVAAEVGEATGYRVVQPVVLNPFPAAEMGSALSGVEQLICVEGNSTGQLARLLAYNGIEPGARILKYDGRPFSVEDLEKRLADMRQEA